MPAATNATVAPRARRARRWRRVAVSTIGALLLTPVLATPAHAALPYQDPTQPVESRIADLLARMSLDDKVGQMTQSERAVTTPSDMTTYRLGSVLSGGGSAPAANTATGWADMIDGLQRGALATPLAIPFLYGVDAVHGDNNVGGATIFPHNIGLGATRNPQLAQQVGRAVAEEMAGSGQHWTFAPCVCAARDDRWGRTYESFSELPGLNLGASVVTGLQGTALGSATPSVLATAKHYVADGGTAGGKDQGNAQITEAELRAIHLPPFKAAVDAGVGSVMASYSSWNSAKLHGNKYLLTDVLKTELGFQGFVVSDWAAIDQLDGALGFTAQEVATGINAGIDMVMVPNDYKTLITLLKQNVANGAVPLARIDDAVRRILREKFKLGLFEHPLTDRSWSSSVGSAAHKAIARKAVAESQVLLKNDAGTLPLAKTGGAVCVAGKNANDMGNQAGGWTVSWQGASGNTIPGTTIYQGIQQVGSSRATSFAADASNVTSSCSVAVAVIGETPYAEGQGDRPNGLALDAVDAALVNKVKATGVPTVVVMVSGRPLDLSTVTPWAKAVVAAWLPGTEGGGVADVLFGVAQPVGKLPMTWPASATQQPINDGDGQVPLYPVGAGLTYAAMPPPPTGTLRAAAAAKGLLIGTALEAGPLSSDAAYSSMAGNEFNYVTPGNEMKWESTEPTQGQFTFASADAIVAYAAAHQQQVRGHTLVWHSQLAGWVSGLTGSALRAAMRNHINGVAGHFAGKVQAWDVVNEAFNDDGTMRQSVFQQQLGTGYIADAFRAARDADPTAKLYINDYNADGINAKSDAIYNLVKQLRLDGVPIDGVGLQMHLIIGQVPSTLQQNIQRFADLGLDVAITEFDDRMTLPADASKLAQQASDFASVTKACIAVARCVSVTTWGFTDKYSWVPGVFPGQGAALEFDANYAKKPAYTAMLDAFSQTARPGSAADTKWPSAPGAPVVTGTTATSVSLSWPAATDNTAVSGYDVYRNGVRVATAASTSFTDTALTTGTAYTYTVRAMDAAGNVSASSASVIATPSGTQPPVDVTPPGVPVGVTAGVITGSSVTLSWAASTDNPGGSGMAGYQVFRGATLVGSPAGTSFTDTGLAASTAYSYTVKAADVAGNISAASAAVSVTTSGTPPPPPSGGVKVQYKSNDTAAADNQIKPGLQVVNTGTSALDLSTVKVRYYFTKDTAATLTFACDYAAIGCGNVSATFGTITPAATGADSYLELSLKGSLAAGAASGEVQSRINHSDWSNFNEADDYSVGANTTFADSTTVTAYVAGTLAWGTPPGGSPPPPTDTTAPGVPAGVTAGSITGSSITLSWAASSDNTGGSGMAGYQVLRAGVLVGSPTATSFTDSGLTASTTYSYTVKAKDVAGNISAASAPVSATTGTSPPPPPGGGIKVQYKNNDASATDNAIRPGLQVVNTSTSALNLTTVQARYYFTRDAGASTFTTYCDYAAIGCANVKSRVVLLTTPVAGADAYLEVTFSGGTLNAGASSGDLQLRFNKTDWTNFTETGDYSYSTSTNYTDAPKVAGYLNGTLAWGTPAA